MAGRRPRPNEEAEGRGDGRERWWRSTVAGYKIDLSPDEDPETRAVDVESARTLGRSPARRGTRRRTVHNGQEASANGRLAVDPPLEITALAQRHGVGTDAIALAAALAQPWTDLVLLGPASVRQLRSALPWT